MLCVGADILVFKSRCQMTKIVLHNCIIKLISELCNNRLKH